MSTRVHKTAVVGPGVDLADEVVVGPHAVVLGPARLMAGVVVGPGAVVGAPPEKTDSRQNVAWLGDLAHQGVEIGAGTVIRELATVQQGSSSVTRIGERCWILSRSYVAHDCDIGEGSTVSAGVLLGGHVRLGVGVNLGMGVTVHQRRSIGAGVMVGMSAAVVRDVPPYALVQGVPATLRGVNRHGMRRLGISDIDIARLQELYAGPVIERAQVPGPLREAWQRWLETEPAKSLLGWDGA